MIYIGSDHRGVELKTQICNYLDSSLLMKYEDIGAFTEESCDYPDIAHKMMLKLHTRQGDIGILICHTSNGMAMTANKYLGVRAAVCWNPEVATLVRQHNDANVLCIPAGFVTNDEAKLILHKFIVTAFDGGRHLRRVENINNIFS
jgi:ribose 5-phosphate isomerase B